METLVEKEKAPWNRFFVPPSVGLREGLMENQVLVFSRLLVASIDSGQEVLFRGTVFCGRLTVHDTQGNRLTLCEVSHRSSYRGIASFIRVTEKDLYSNPGENLCVFLPVTFFKSDRSRK